MLAEPFPDLTNAEFSPCDGFRNEPMSPKRLDFKKVRINAEKSVGDRETNPLISVEECVIVGERFHQRGSFVNQIVVISILRAINGGFEESAVPQSMHAPKLLDEQAVHFYRFGDRRIEMLGHLLSK